MTKKSEIKVSQKKISEQEKLTIKTKYENFPTTTNEFNKILSRRPLKIYFIVPGLGISGGNNVVLEYCSYLISLGHDVSIINIRHETTVDWHPIKHIPIFRTMDSWAVSKFVSEEIDIVVATGWQTCYEILRIGISARTFVYFVQCNEILFNSPGSWEYNLASITYKLPFKFLTISKWLVNFLKFNYGQESFYAPNRYNPKIVYEDTPIAPRKNDGVRILLEGPLCNPWKAMDDAFLSVQGLDAEVWCLSGAGELQPWQKPDKFFSGVPYNKVKNIMSSCDILVKLSKIEGFFGPPLEMMACGGTAVVSRVAGYDEYIKEGINALAVDVGDYRSARECLRELISNRALLEKLKKEGRKTAKEFSFWEHTLKTVNEFFYSIVEFQRNPKPIAVPKNMTDFVELALDVTYSRHSDNPELNRKTWNRVSDYQAVRMYKLDDLQFMRVSGWAMGSSRRLPVKKICTNLQFDRQNETLRYVARTDVCADRGVLPPVDCGFTFVELNRLDNPLKIRLYDFDGSQIDLSVKSGSHVDMPGQIVCYIDDVEYLDGYHVTYDPNENHWECRKGKNIPLTLGVFCSKIPKDIIITNNDDETIGFIYPAIEYREVPDNIGLKFVDIDLAQIYKHDKKMDFFIIVDRGCKLFFPSASEKIIK